MYLVYWTPEALDELTVLWTGADSATRTAITQATDLFDRLLARNPGHVGESRDELQRIAFQAPLGLTFEIDERRRIAFVLHVWQCRKRRGTD
jgi:hypothetical protein